MSNWDASDFRAECGEISYKIQNWQITFIKFIFLHHMSWYIVHMPLMKSIQTQALANWRDLYIMQPSTCLCTYACIARMPKMNWAFLPVESYCKGSLRSFWHMVPTFAYGGYLNEHPATFLCYLSWSRCSESPQWVTVSSRQARNRSNELLLHSRTMLSKYMYVLWLW